jgi:hypothetical protein
LVTHAPRRQGIKFPQGWPSSSFRCIRSQCAIGRDRTPLSCVKSGSGERREGLDAEGDAGLGWDREAAGAHVAVFVSKTEDR